MGGTGAEVFCLALFQAYRCGKCSLNQVWGPTGPLIFDKGKDKFLDDLEREFIDY